MVSHMFCHIFYTSWFLVYLMFQLRFLVSTHLFSSGLRHYLLHHTHVLITLVDDSFRNVFCEVSVWMELFLESISTVRHFHFVVLLDLLLGFGMQLMDIHKHQEILCQSKGGPSLTLKYGLMVCKLLLQLESYWLEETLNHEKCGLFDVNKIHDDGDALCFHKEMSQLECYVLSEVVTIGWTAVAENDSLDSE